MKCEHCSYTVESPTTCVRCGVQASIGQRDLLCRKVVPGNPATDKEQRA